MTARREATLEFAEHFGKTLFRRRRKLGLSQEELAYMTSLHRTEISFLERGMRLPRIDTLVKLSVALDASYDELLNGLGWFLPGPSGGSFDVARSP